MLQENALSTLDYFKTCLNIPNGDTTQDLILSMMINASSDAIEEFCNRKFNKTSYEEKLTATNLEYLTLKNFPIHTITSIKFDTQDITGYEIISDRGQLFKSGGFAYSEFNYYDPDSRYSEINKSRIKERGIAVEYEAGYILPKDATIEAPSTLPAALQSACILYAMTLKSSMEAIQTIAKASAGVQSERIGDYQINYNNNPQAISLIKSTNGLPDAVKALINPYVGR